MIGGRSARTAASSPTGRTRANSRRCRAASTRPCACRRRWRASSRLGRKSSSRASRVCHSASSGTSAGSSGWPGTRCGSSPASASEASGTYSKPRRRVVAEVAEHLGLAYCCAQPTCEAALRLVRVRGAAQCTGDRFLKGPALPAVALQLGPIGVRIAREVERRGMHELAEPREIRGSLRHRRGERDGDRVSGSAVAEPGQLVVPPLKAGVGYVVTRAADRVRAIPPRTHRRRAAAGAHRAPQRAPRSSASSRAACRVVAALRAPASRYSSRLAPPSPSASRGSRASFSTGAISSISRPGRSPSSVNLRAPGSTWCSSEPTALL